MPTQFHSRDRFRAVSGGLHPGCDQVSADGYVAEPLLMVSAKHKRRSRGREALSLVSTTDRLSPTHRSSTQRRTGKTRSRTRGTSTMEGSDHNHDQGPSPFHLLVSPTRPCMVLDAVEIVSKQRSHDHMANLRAVCDGCSTENAHEPTSHCLSPPVSCAPKDTVDDNSSRPIMEPEERASPDPTLPSKTSKYFACVSTPQTRSVPGRIPVLTPTSSPIPTIPVYIESSDFEYPPLDISLDEPVEDPEGEPGYISSWHNNPALFDDLMIMLRRLKPILVQGVWSSLPNHLATDERISFPPVRVWINRECTRRPVESTHRCPTAQCHNWESRHSCLLQDFITLADTPGSYAR